MKEYEEAVLGALLLDAPAVRGTVFRLSEEDFEDPELRRLFASCRRLFDGGKPIDALTASAGDRELLKTAVLCAQSTPSLSNCGEYVALVRREGRRRRARSRALELMGELEDGGDGRRTLTELQRLLSPGERPDVPAAEGFARVLETAGKPRRYLATGFPALDRMVKLSPGDYLVVGGRPSAGKTALTLQILLYMARSVPCVYYSLETGADKLYGRMAACGTGADFAELKRGGCPEALRLGCGELGKLSLRVAEASGWSVRDIRAHALQSGARAIFVDYLSLVRGEGGTLYERVTEISRSLRETAQRDGLLVTALSQLSRQGTGDSPGLSSLRESGQVEQDADCVLLLAGEGSRRTLNVAKNKEGVTGKLLLEFSGKTQRFREAEQ